MAVGLAWETMGQAAVEASKGLLHLHSKYSPQGQQLQPCSSEPHVIKGLVNRRRNSMLENSSSGVDLLCHLASHHLPLLLLHIAQDLVLLPSTELVLAVPDISISQGKVCWRSW